MSFTEEKLVTSTKMNRTKSISSHESFKISDGYGHVGYIIMYGSGNYVYNVNNGQIASAYGAKLKSVDYSDLADWSFTQKNISTSSKISTNGYKAIFSISLNSYGTYNYNGQEFESNIPFGRSTLTFEGQAD